MRRRANQAITTAMDLGLNRLGAAATEAQRRAWWSAMFMLILSSIDHETPPINSLGDQRITTPYPSFHNQPELWPLLLQAGAAILSVSQTLRNHNAHSTVEPSSSSNISAKITQLDSNLSKLTRKLDRSPQLESGISVDTQGLRTMWAIAQALAYSARVRLHRVRVFTDIPLYINNHCDLISYQETRNPSQTLSSGIFTSSVFPFTEAQSSLICLKASLAMVRAYERVAIFAEGGPTVTSRATTTPPQAHIVLPFFMCGAMQASYVLLITHYRLQVSLRSKDQGSTYSHLLHHPEPGFEVQDTERLLRELRQGIDSVLRVVRLATMFEGIRGMGEEIQAAYHGVCAGDF
ncbi:fungal specific transcription factor domain-containing protein [Aspergillus melleus]|uniref:fungal specific transcription factor domain-containing protein n=1 Tax=Aspergillus melleus TaxID=138277 RepID=UPI001E8D06A3|nr:uncharacterized protein LDX57_004478 [Aspergillus melleus]KAH8426745.1 hypothetical protein LDX57_004478 [Aspergillus melleus]